MTMHWICLGWERIWGDLHYATSQAHFKMSCKSWLQSSKRRRLSSLLRFKKCFHKLCLFHVSREKIFCNNITNVKIPGWIPQIKLLKMQASQGQNLAISSVTGDPEWIQHFSRSYTEVSFKYLNNYFLSKVKQISISCVTQ